MPHSAIPRILGSLGSRNRKAPLCRESGPEDGLAENIDVSELNLQREVLIHRGKSDDHTALLAELRHGALDSLKNAAADAHWCSQEYIRMGP